MLRKIAILLTTLLLGSLVVTTCTESAIAMNPYTASTDNSGYIVIPSKSTITSYGIQTVYDTITQGETNWHTKTVSSYITTLNVDLNWGNSANSLRLRLYSPDGAVFGPYYDIDDGVIDGRINIDIYNPNGIARGTWYAEVYGYQVTGTQSYSI